MDAVAQVRRGLWTRRRNAVACSSRRVFDSVNTDDDVRLQVCRESLRLGCGVTIA